MNAWINPLAFLDVEGPPAPNLPAVPTAETVLGYLCPPGTSSEVAALVSRYKEIATEPVALAVVPAEQRILDKLVWPLRHAKASYMVGNDLAVIALAGMVAEMVALLRREVAEVSLNGRPMTPEDERSLFGSSFERLGQERRLQVLAAYGLIDAATKGRFDTIKETRRGYLHLWSQDHESLPKDAITSYHAAVALVATTIGQDFQDGKIVINQPLVKYLERQGVYQPRDETPAV
jgi:hypothetical protein